MKVQDKLHIPPLLGDQRKPRIAINPLLQKFAERITTLKFQILLISMMALVDYIYILINGVSEKISEFLILYSLEALFFFTYIHSVFPKLARGSHSLFVILSVIVTSLLLFIILQLLILSLFTENPTQFFFELSPKYVIGALYRGWHRMILSFFLWSAYIVKDSAKREQVLENNFLFSRISPHLLFNALNMLPTETNAPLKNDRIIELLSRYTRNAMMELGEDGKGLLSSELDQLDTLLELNELRFGNIYIQLRKELPDDLTAYRIPPQIIVTLAENIFIYGIVNDPGKPARIKICEHNRYLRVKMTNYKYTIEKYPSSKIGINSVKKRLMNIYGKNYHFKISESLELFSVEIGFPV